MAGEIATFAVNLDGNLESGSLANAAALEKMADAMDDDLAALKAMQGALRSLKSGSMAASDEAKELTKQIAAQKAAIAGSNAALVRSGMTTRDLIKAKRAAGEAEKAAKELEAKRAAATQKRQMEAVKAASKAATESREALRAISSQFQVTNSSAVSLIGQIKTLGSAVGKAGLAGAIALGVLAFVAVTGALVGATAALAAYAVKVVEARRAEMLRLEALTRLPNYFGIAAGKASDMQAAIDRVSSSVALGRGKISEYAMQLYRMGLRGKNLDEALEGTAIRSSVLGEEMGSAFASMAAGAALTGQSVTAMTKRVKGQLGDLAQKQMLSLSVQTEKLKENLDVLFKDVKIEGFLGGFAEVAKAFSQASATGRALKAMLERLLNPLLGSANSTGLVVKRFFQGMVLGALMVENRILRLRVWWRETFGEMKLKVDLATAAVYVGMAAMGALTVTVGVLTAAMVALGAASMVVVATSAIGAALILAPFLLLPAAIYAVVKLVKWCVVWLYNNAKDIPWGEIGTAILNGITRPLSKLWDAGKRLGKQMLAGFKSAWEIASPSKVANRLVSRDIVGGAEKGADDSGKRVGRKLGKAMFPASTGGYDGASGFGGGSGVGGGKGGASGTSRGGGIQAVIEQLIMQFTLPEGDPKTQSRAAASEFAKLLEGALAEMGG